MDKMQSPPADLLLSKYYENNLVKKTNGEEILDMNISICKIKFRGDEDL